MRLKENTNGRVSARVLVHRPQDEVWTFLTDWSRYPEWDSTTYRAEQVDDGPPRKGTRFRWVGRLAGRRIPFESTLTECEPPHRMAYVATSGPGPLVGSSGWTQVSPAGDACVVEVGASLAPGLGRTLAHVADPLFSWWLRHTMSRDLRRLRTILEGSPPQ